MSWTQHPTGHHHPPCSPVPREEGSIPTSLCEQPQDAHSCWHDHHWLAWWHQGSPLPIMHTYWQQWQDPHCGRWPCPTWRSPHHPSIRKGEDTTATPPVPSRNHQSPVVCACGCVFWPGINKAIEEAVWQCETCTQSQAQNTTAPLTPMHQLHPTNGRCAPWTYSPWKELTTSYAVTSIQRWFSSDIFHLARATLSKSSHC